MKAFWSGKEANQPHLSHIEGTVLRNIPQSVTEREPMRCPTLVELPPPPAGKTGWPWTEETPQAPPTTPDGRTWPRFSIVTPSLNQGQFIEETIRSVLLQGYPNLEYIIIDGGSTDSSVGIIQKYEPWLAYYVSEPDRGQAHAINKGFEVASGDIFAWLNSDDHYLAGALRTVGTCFASENGLEVLVGIGHMVDVTGKVVYTPQGRELNFKGFLDWLRDNFLQPSCFFSRNAWVECGPLNESLHYCLDLDLWLRMSRKFTFKKKNELLSHATLHAMAKTTAWRERSAVETSIVVLKNGGDDIARQTLMEMADSLAEARSKISAVTGNPLYRLIVGPIYRRVRHAHRWFQQDFAELGVGRQGGPR